MLPETAQSILEGPQGGLVVQASAQRVVPALPKVEHQGGEPGDERRQIGVGHEIPREAQGKPPPSPPVVDDEGDQRREGGGAGVVGALAFPDAHHVAQQLQQGPPVGVGLVLHQDVHQQGGAAQAGSHQDVCLVGGQLRIDEGLSGDLQGVQVQPSQESRGQCVAQELSGELRPSEDGAEEAVVRLVQLLHTRF